MASSAKTLTPRFIPSAVYSSNEDHPNSIHPNTLEISHIGATTTKDKTNHDKSLHPHWYGGLGERWDTKSSIWIAICNTGLEVRARIDLAGSGRRNWSFNSHIVGGYCDRDQLWDWRRCLGSHVLCRFIAALATWAFNHLGWGQRGVSSQQQRVGGDTKRGPKI